MRKSTLFWGIATSPIVLIGLAFGVFGANETSVPNSFSAGTTASAAQVNANFTALATAVTDNVPWRTRLDYNTKVQSTTSPTVTTWTLHRTFGTFTKHRASTDVVIGLDTDILVNGVSAQFQLRVDGAADPLAVNSGMLLRVTTGSVPINDAASTKAIFKGLAAGTHTVSLWVRSLDGPNTAVSENDANVNRTVFIEESPSR